MNLSSAISREATVVRHHGDHAQVCRGAGLPDGPAPGPPGTLGRAQYEGHHVLVVDWVQYGVQPHYDLRRHLAELLQVVGVPGVDEELEVRPGYERPGPS